MITINQNLPSYQDSLPPVLGQMNSGPLGLPTFPTLTQVNSAPIPSIDTGFTPMVLTTDANGNQTLTPVAAPTFGRPASLGVLSQISLSGYTVLPVMTPSPSPVMNLGHPSPRRPSFGPNTSASSLNIPTPHGSPSNSRESWESSVSRERDFLPMVDDFETERPQEPKIAVTNEQNIPTPTLTNDMTKKDLVNATLDWFYAVLGSSNFDCEGRRGKNVLRIKVKTRGALEHICPLIDQCIKEKLLYHVSCPISTKKQRRHIRGYLAYLEAVSAEATNRMIEIFEEINKVLVKNCDGILEHPFKGISRNPIAVRQRSGHIAA